MRGYVTQGKTDSYDTPTARYATTSQRRALATMGRRGGKKATKRWEPDPEGEYAQSQRKICRMPTSESARWETIRGHKFWRSHRRSSIRLAGFLRGKKIAHEVNVSRRTVAYHAATRKEVGLYRGRCGR